MHRARYVYIAGCLYYTIRTGGGSCVWPTDPIHTDRSVLFMSTEALLFRSRMLTNSLYKIRLIWKRWSVVFYIFGCLVVFCGCVLHFTAYTLKGVPRLFRLYRCYAGGVLYKVFCIKSVRSICSPFVRRCIWCCTFNRPVSAWYMAFIVVLRISTRMPLDPCLFRRVRRCRAFVFSSWVHFDSRIPTIIPCVQCGSSTCTSGCALQSAVPVSCTNCLVTPCIITIVTTDRRYRHNYAFIARGPSIIIQEL